MLKLIGFEFQRKRTLLVVALVLLILAEIFILYQYNRIIPEMRDAARFDLFGATSGLLIIVLGMVYFIDLIALIRNDMFKQEGYMLFMTPNSGYTLIGSKVLFGLLEGVAIAAILAGLLFFNGKMMGVNPEYLFTRGIESMLFNPMLFLKMFALMVFVIIEFALTVYLSFALFKSLFTNIRFKGGITFIIFIAVNFFKYKISELVVHLVPSASAQGSMGALGTLYGVWMNFEHAITLSLFISIAFSALLFVGTGYLVEKRINL